MIHFILNNTTIQTDCHPGTTLLDFIRYHKHLTGTKIGCREGDCGACTVLAGKLDKEHVEYHAVTSCLMPIGNAAGMHIATIEGINPGMSLTPVQQAMSDQGATQCGFCTPGFIMSLTGYSLQQRYSDPKAAIDGNICRCTGYKSIERAAQTIASILEERNMEPVRFAVEKGFVPEYFEGIHQRLKELPVANSKAEGQATAVGGGTDLYVQKHDAMTHSSAIYLNHVPELKGIEQKDDRCIIGAATTVTELSESLLMKNIFPSFHHYIKLLSSTPIRNMATVAGNFVNASPIGDLTIFFLPLDTEIVLRMGENRRVLSLSEFYKGYKKLDLHSGETVESLSFRIPGDHAFFNFEKVSKRTHLDIASVNSAMLVTMEEDIITRATISAGGVGPVPLVLANASSYLSGKRLNEEAVKEVCKIASNEISPISDARGSAQYKTLLLTQLIKAHFLRHFHFLQTHLLMQA